MDFFDWLYFLDIKPYIPSYDVPNDKEVKTASWLNQTKKTVVDIGFTARADRQVSQKPRALF